MKCESFQPFRYSHDSWKYQLNSHKNYMKSSFKAHFCHLDTNEKQKISMEAKQSFVFTQEENKIQRRNRKMVKTIVTLLITVMMFTSCSLGLPFFSDGTAEDRRRVQGNKSQAPWRRKLPHHFPQRRKCTANPSYRRRSQRNDVINGDRRRKTHPHAQSQQYKGVLWRKVISSSFPSAL